MNRNWQNTYISKFKFHSYELSKFVRIHVATVEVAEVELRAQVSQQGTDYITIAIILHLYNHRSLVASVVFTLSYIHQY